MSMGILLDSDLIWTGWASYTTDTGTPTSTDVPIISIIPMTVEESTIPVGVPTVVFVSFRIFH